MRQSFGLANPQAFRAELLQDALAVGKLGMHGGGFQRAGLGGGECVPHVVETAGILATRAEHLGEERGRHLVVLRVGVGGVHRDRPGGHVGGETCLRVAVGAAQLARGAPDQEGDAGAGHGIGQRRAFHGGDGGGDHAHGSLLGGNGMKGLTRAW